jgi:cytochrome c-type biogenesis protein CcmH/NrfF
MKLPVLGGLVLVLVCGAAAAASPSQVATEVAQNVMSPFCPGLTLHDCPSSPADDLRERIEAWARAGQARGQIMARLRAEYGPSIAAAPEPRGVGLVAWVLPIATLLAGVVVVVALTQRWRAPAAQRAARPRLSGEARARLDAELAQAREEP